MGERIFLAALLAVGGVVGAATFVGGGYLVLWLNQFNDEPTAGWKAMLQYGTFYFVLSYCWEMYTYWRKEFRRW